MEEQVKQQEQIQTQQQNQEPELTNYKETQYSAKVLTLMGKLIEWSVNMVWPAAILGMLSYNDSWIFKIFLSILLFFAFMFFRGLLYLLGKKVFDFCCAATIKINHIGFLRVSQAVLNTILLIPFLFIFLVLAQGIIVGFIGCIRLFIK